MLVTNGEDFTPKNDVSSTYEFVISIR